MTPVVRSTLKAALSALPIFAPVTMRPVDAAPSASTYTRHDFRRCAERASPEPGVIEVRACAGHAGLPVVWTGEPDSGSVAFGKAPTKSSASDGPIPGLDSFHEARGTVEWRGPAVGGRRKPLAAIVRYDTGPAVACLSSSRLVVYRLAPRGISCVMGVVKGSAADANAAARAIVDRHAAGFACGRGAALREP